MHFIFSDNQAISAAGLRLYVQQLFGAVPTVAARTKRELLAALEQAPEATVLLDYALFDFTGIENLLIYMRRFPLSHWLLLAGSLSEAFVRQIAAEPTATLVRKEDDDEELRAALRYAAEGTAYRSAYFRNLLAHDPTRDDAGLTRVEQEVLRLIAEGKSSKDIAALRHSSVHTIVTHRKNIFRKLGVNNVYEAARYALRAGLISPVEYYI